MLPANRSSRNANDPWPWVLCITLTHCLVRVFAPHEVRECGLDEPNGADDRMQVVASRCCLRATVTCTITWCSSG